MRNRFLWLSLAAVIALGTLAYTYTLQYAVTLDGKTTYYQKWGSGTISMAYNLTFPSQFASSNPNPSLVQAVIKNDMLNVWNSVLKANKINVQFADGGATTSVQNAGCDGVNVITFNYQSAGSPAPTGVSSRSPTFSGCKCRGARREPARRFRQPSRDRFTKPTSLSTLDLPSRPTDATSTAPLSTRRTISKAR